MNDRTWLNKDGLNSPNSEGDLKRLGISTIPTGWRLSTVGDACTIRNDLRMPISTEVRGAMKGQYPYYGPTGILDHLNEFRAEGSFALIGEDGDHFLDVDRKSQTIRVTGRFNVNNHAHLVAEGFGCTVEWFFHFFRHRDISHSLTRQGASRFKLTKKALEQLPILLPPLAEQRKIAEILRTWDEAIEKLEALRAAKAQRSDAVAQKLMGPSRYAESQTAKSNWMLTSFGDVLKERRDRNKGLSADSVVTVGKYAIRRQSEHFSRSVASKDQSAYWMISPGDFVYDPMSAYYGALGRYDGPHEGIVSPAYRVIRLEPDVDSDFMVHLLRTHHIRSLLESRSSQGNKEGKRRLLQRAEFEGIEFYLPPLEIQREIAAKLSVFERDVDLVRRLLAETTLQKRGLMQRLLTGEWPLNTGRDQ